TQPAPQLTAKQAAALQHLRSAGKALELRQLARLAHCGAGPVDALITKGVARRTLLRVDRCVAESEEIPASEGPITLNPDQLRAWATVEQALRQGGFKAFL